jgi:anti-anti-sigma regulatory factor/anti-sigma regulatory factor (Ser/Thr protein kinase)
MAPHLRCTAVHEPPLAILRADGTLTLQTATELRTALLKCLAEQPAAILVDAAGLTLADDLSVTAFIAAARHAAAWPAVPLLVCAPSSELRAALRRLGADRQVPVCDDLSQGRTAAARRALPAQVSDRYPATVPSVRAAREMVTTACERWRVPTVVEPARLVATELVTNSVRHAGTPIDLIVTLSSRYLHLAVRDYDPRPPRLVGPDGETAPGGRGLLLVEAVSATWGYTSLTDGKVTWASLSRTVRPGFQSHWG